MLKLEDFKKFELENKIHIKGGYKKGTITGSSVYQGNTTVDVDWDDGTTECDHQMNGPDGSTDDLVGNDLFEF